MRSTNIIITPLEKGSFYMGPEHFKESLNMRAEKYEYFINSCINNPFIVGAHYFQYLDQPTAGRGDGENFRCGFLTICDRPYTQIINVFRKTGNLMKKPIISLGLILCLITCKAEIIEVKPGSSRSTIQSAVNSARAGDTILVRAGIYRESVEIGISGTEEQALVIMAFPGEKVVLDGSEILTGWSKPVGLRESLGNPDWNNIYYTNAPEKVNRVSINLFQGESSLTLAQYPEAKDPFYDEKTGEWITTPDTPGSYTSKSLTDPVHLSGKKFTDLTGGYFKVVAGNNFVYIQKITAHDPNLSQITFEPILDEIRIIPGKNRYIISNHPVLVDKPGKYYFDETNRRVYIWPYDEKTIHSTITATVRDKAFYFRGIKHVIIDGFVIRRYFGKNISGTDSDHITIRNCTIEQGIIQNDGGAGPSIDMYRCTYCAVEGCTIRNNKHARGIIFNNGSYNKVSGCVMRRTGGTVVDLYREKNSSLLNNNLRDCNGQHANGLTCYLACRNILISGNVVINCNNGLTYQEIDSMMVVNNIFHGGDRTAPTACWNASNSTNVSFIHNTLIGSGSRHEAVHTQNGRIKNLVIRNNILDGMSVKEGAEVSHNLYLSQSKNQHPLSDSDIYFPIDPDQLFTDPVRDDYRLRAGVKAIDAGVKLEVRSDLYGNPRPYRKRSDIGHHEWRPGDK